MRCEVCDKDAKWLWTYRYGQSKRKRACEDCMLRLTGKLPPTLYDLNEQRRKEKERRP